MCTTRLADGLGLTGARATATQKIPNDDQVKLYTDVHHCHWKFISLRPVPHPINDISIEFEIRPKFEVVWFKIYSTDYNKILHIDVCKKSLWSVEHVLNHSTPNFYQILNSIEMPLVGRGPGEAYMAGWLIIIGPGNGMLPVSEYPLRYLLAQPWHTQLTELQIVREYYWSAHIPGSYDVMFITTLDMPVTCLLMLETEYPGFRVQYHACWCPGS